MSFEITTIGEFASVQGGYAYKSQDFQLTAKWPVLKIKNVRHGYVDYSDISFVSDSIALSTSNWRTKTGDILISMTGSGPSAPESLVGRVARVWKGDTQALINQRVGRLVLKDGSTIDSDFLFYVLSTKETQDYLVSNSTGSANQVNISAKTIESVGCPKIGLIESRNIASFLRSLDKRIRLLRETNTTLESIAQALFKSWFVDFDPVKAKAEGRLPEGMDEATAALFPNEFEASALGLIPKGWKVGALGDVASYLSRGISPKYTDLGGVLVLNQKCIRDFSVDVAKGRRHDQNLRKIQGRELEIGDVLVNSTGVGTLGRVAQILDLVETTIVDSHVTVVRASQELSWPYLGLALMRKQAEIESLGEGTTGQTELSRSKLAALRLLMPPRNILDIFDDFITPLREKISRNEKQTQTLTTLRDTLLPRLISGQLRLNQAQDLVDEVAA